MLCIYAYIYIVFSFVSATDATYEVAVAAFKLPVVVSTHNSNNISVDGILSVSPSVIETVAATATVKSDSTLINNQTKQIDNHCQGDISDSNNINVLNCNNNNNNTHNNSSILLLSAEQTTELHQSSHIISNNSNRIINSNRSECDSELAIPTMVLQHLQRSYDNKSHNPTVIIQNAQARHHQQHSGSSASPPRYGSTSAILTENGGVNNGSGGIIVSNPLRSPSSSPIRYSTLQTLHTNNDQHYITVNNNNNDNYANDWNYNNLSLDLRHKHSADTDKISEKHHHQQQHSTSLGDNEIIEQRNIIAATNNNHHYGSDGDIQQQQQHQQTVDHHHQQQPNINSADAAAMRTGLQHVSMYQYHQSQHHHHSIVNAATGEPDESSGTGEAPPPNSTIDEVIADTLKDENDDASYLTLSSTNDMQNHLKDTSAYIQNINNNSTSSGDGGGGGDSRSPTGLSHEDFDSGLHSFTNLTSANNSSRCGSVGGAVVVGAVGAGAANVMYSSSANGLQTNDHSAIMHPASFETGIHSTLPPR